MKDSQAPEAHTSTSAARVQVTSVSRASSISSSDWDKESAFYSLGEMSSEVSENEKQDVEDKLRPPTRTPSPAEQGGLSNGTATPFRYIPKSAIGRLPAISEKPNECDVLQVDGADEEDFNPNFDSSSHLPSEVPVNLGDRREHDNILPAAPQGGAGPIPPMSNLIAMPTPFVPQIGEYQDTAESLYRPFANSGKKRSRNLFWPFHNSDKRRPKAGHKVRTEIG